MIIPERLEEIVTLYFFTLMIQILREIIANQMEDAEAEWRALHQEG